MGHRRKRSKGSTLNPFKGARVINKGGGGGEAKRGGGGGPRAGGAVAGTGSDSGRRHERGKASPIRRCSREC